MKLKKDVRQITEEENKQKEDHRAIIMLKGPRQGNLFMEVYENYHIKI